MPDIIKHLPKGTKIKVTWPFASRTLYVSTAINYFDNQGDDWYIEAYEQLEPEPKGYYYIKQRQEQVTIEILESA